MRYNRAPSVKCIILVYFSEMEKCVKIKGSICTHMVEKKSTKVREDKKTSIKLDTWNVFQKKKKLDKWISIRVMDKSVNKVQSIQLNYIQNIRFVCIQIIQNS